MQKRRKFFLLHLHLTYVSDIIQDHISSSRRTRTRTLCRHAIQAGGEEMSRHHAGPHSSGIPSSLAEWIAAYGPSYQSVSELGGATHTHTQNSARIRTELRSALLPTFPSIPLNFWSKRTSSSHHWHFSDNANGCFIAEVDGSVREPAQCRPAYIPELHHKFLGAALKWHGSWDENSSVVVSVPQETIYPWRRKLVFSVGW